MKSNVSVSKPLKSWTPASLMAVIQPMWPGQISEKSVLLLLERGSIAKFKPGDVVARQGSSSKGLHILLTGQAEVVSLRASGREQMRYILGPGEGFSFLHLYHPDPHTSSLIAREACEVLIISKSAWLKTTDECPELKDAVISIVTHRLRLALETIEISSFATGLVRLAHRLLWHIRKTPIIDSPDPTPQTYFDVQLSQTDLARMLSLSRQRTSALLHQLEEQGIITLQYRHILVHDLASLRKVIASNDIA